MRPPLKLMALLRKHGAMSQTEAGEHLGLSRQQAARQCYDLEQRGWAKRVADPDDRRYSLFSLTEAGKQAFEQKGGKYDNRYRVRVVSEASAD